MRALNSPEVISVLKSQFINCWLLAKDLETIAKETNDPDIEKLCKLIRLNYKYPVDSVLIAPDLAVLGHGNVNQQYELMFPDGYASFLNKGLTAAGVAMPEPVEKETQSPDAAAMPQDGRTKITDVAPKQPVGLTLTREKPSGSLLEIARHEGNGQPGFAFYPIDVSDFADGGTLEITVRVGSGDATTKCELCAPMPGNDSFFVQLDSMEVAPGECKTLAHKFEDGGPMSLVVKAIPQPDSPPQASPILATISVK